jgi:2-phosphosulfolactate phosphatase
MRVDVIELPERLGEADRSGQLFVVVDVLRLCSTMVTAFANGCEAVIPVAEPTEAFALRERRPEVRLAGERGGYMIEGFDLGNSPFEMTRAAVGGRTLVMCSTNGTKAVVAGRAGASAIVACFLNASAAARHAQAEGRDVAILCSGKLGATAPEDVACAGLLVEKIEGLAGRPRARLTAGAAEALALYRAHRDDLARLVGECEHGRYLASIGMGRDVPYCAQVDVFDLVPRLEDGVIRCGGRDARG